MQTAADSFLNPSAEPDPRLDCEVGLEYRVVRHLASGGMANVFLAEHSQDGSYAAAKFIDPASDIPASLLQYEAYQLARIRNPHVVRALEYGRTRQGLDYLLLEYVSGIDRAEWIASARQGMPRPRWLHVLSQLADAIDCLHACGVVHGDIKPVAHPAWLPVFARALHECPSLRFASARAFVAALSPASADLSAQLAWRKSALRKSCGHVRSAPRNHAGSCGTACE